MSLADLRATRRVTAALVGAAMASALAACGSGRNDARGGANGSASGRHGGVITVLDVGGGVDSLDPGYWYYQTDYADLAETTQRQLYYWRPSAINPVPDLATGYPVASDGGRTLTIHIRRHVRYSPPLEHRTVTAADIKYGLERCFDANVGNGYAGSYFSHIVGAPTPLPSSVPNIPGIQTPTPTTLVIKLTQPVGVLASGQALGLPCSTPVPQSYAAKYDRGAAPSYGMHQVFTGPYMIKGSGTGTVPAHGYTANRVLDLVRNPSWVSSTDTRPAYFNEIVIKEGYQPESASQAILTGQGMLSGDFAAPPPDIARRYLQSRHGQFRVEPSQGIRYVAMNPKIKPLDNVDVRRAIIAATDRSALILTRGGRYIGLPATHTIPPEMQGFALAGGGGGPGSDFYASPSANLSLAKAYMRKAGYPSGRYTGPTLLAVGDNSAPGKQTAETFVQQMGQLGFKVQLTEVPHKTMLSRFCAVPRSQPAFCPNMAWGKDFFDSQSMLDPLLSGLNIATSGNSNTAQVNDPTLNRMLSAASKLIDGSARARAYADIDRYATAHALYDDWIWDNEAALASANVSAVYNKQNTNWDLVFSSLK